jgi:hypothetical protein
MLGIIADSFLIASGVARGGPEQRAPGVVDSHGAARAPRRRAKRAFWRSRKPGPGPVEE